MAEIKWQGDQKILQLNPEEDLVLKQLMKESEKLAKISGSIAAIGLVVMIAGTPMIIAKQSYETGGILSFAGLALFVICFLINEINSRFGKKQRFLNELKRKYNIVRFI